MSELMKLEELLVKGRMSRREFLSRVSILGLTGAVSPALWRSIAHAETPKKGGTFRIGLSRCQHCRVARSRNLRDRGDQPLHGGRDRQLPDRDRP